MDSRRAGGFTLIEVLISVAICAVLVLIAAGLHVGSLDVYHRSVNRSTLAEDVLLLVDYVRGELMGVGGGSVRGWMGIWVEDGCGPRSIFPACGGADRVTLSTLTIPVQECSIVGMVTPTTLQIIFSSPGVCCLKPQAAGEVSYVGKPVMVTLNDFYSQRFVTAVDLVACTMGVVPGQAAGGDQTGGTADWSGGMVSMMQVETLYLNRAQNTLQRFVDLNNNGVADLGEDQVVADQIFDFQIALGYDFKPADGRVTATANGVNDEWLYNAPGVAEALGAGFFVPPPARSALLLAQVGITSGVSDPAGLVLGSLLNGPPRNVPGWALRSGTAIVGLRNTYIFQ